MNILPKLIKGNKFINDKGTINFVNNFSLKSFKRFYQIDLPKTGIIRAFHGHMRENKAVFVISGSLLLCLVKLTDAKNPSRKTKIKKIVLMSSYPQVCKIPPGYANGIMSLEKNTQVVFFSDKTLKESEKDDYRFPEDYWGKKIWDHE